MLIVLAATYFIPKVFPHTPPREIPDGNLEATFIDIGQGNSFIMRTADNRSILIDGGEDDNYETHLEPYLDSLNIDSVDIAVVTHYHSDHMGGISQLVEDGRVKKLILPDYPDTDNSRKNIEKSASNENIPIEYISSGSKIDVSYNGLQLDVLHPPKGGFTGNEFHNNSSLVLRITYGETSILITGDIEARAEKAIIEDEDIECDILCVPHHGSSSSSSKDFINAANPTYAIISAGQGNSYGHPHNETLDTLRDADATICRTDRDGNITFTITPEKIDNIDYSK